MNGRRRRVAASSNGVAWSVCLLVPLHHLRLPQGVNATRPPDSRRRRQNGLQFILKRHASSHRVQSCDAPSARSKLAAPTPLPCTLPRRHPCCHAHDLWTQE
ncbi:hypothetical protein BU23DRAFT_337481 [Bimuria novae-zelandiae CBS 107.79]|uniref:Secreted protein n=1 Tax=Bimuria novae-zelandiae CBS 107.79 TaxID=1447943 RepID=A0A6A5UNE7_9PLEO|nr:hypothetical protein BU23DRAFT_337481 [Bimuria novae-zelandiae CBS 107.79]